MRVNIMKYFIIGNNRGSYDILLTDNKGNVQFIAEVMNEDIAHDITAMLNNSL